VDESIGGLDISRVIFESSEGLLSDDDIVDEILAEGTLVDKRLSSEVGKVGGSDSGGSNLSDNDVGLAAVGIKRSEVGFVSLDGGVDRGEDGVRSSSKFGGNTSGLKTFYEKSEVVISLKVGFFLSDGNTVSSPNLSRSLEGSKGVDEATSGSRGGGSRSRSGGSRSGGSRGSGSRGGGGRGGGGTTVTHG